MQTYNKIMLYFWLFSAVLIFLTVTYLGITDGFKKWSYYYVLAVMALFAYLSRKWMLKRYAKHQEFLNQQNKEN